MRPQKHKQPQMLRQEHASPATKNNIRAEHGSRAAAVASPHLAARRNISKLRSTHCHNKL